MEEWIASGDIYEEKKHHNVVLLAEMQTVFRDMHTAGELVK